ncbi:unnamed protein product [Pieris macdunnoughi]|uniref:Uncharacterized protein n=1 Tax=Pieris macdunnoughi TaxID=345717 RepID=A0A821XX13_9NEOP|nr:unnamed protein product [Pieris macdunnoughi]
MGVPRVSSTASAELELGRARRPHLLILDDSREARLTEDLVNVVRKRVTSSADLDPEVGHERIPRSLRPCYASTASYVCYELRSGFMNSLFL